MLKAFFSRPMKRRKAPLQKPRVFLSVGRVSGMLTEELTEAARALGGGSPEKAKEVNEGLGCGT